MFTSFLAFNIWGSDAEFWQMDKELIKKESEQYGRLLPSLVYSRVCKILQLPPVDLSHAEAKASAPEGKTGARKIVKRPKLAKRITIEIERELSSDTDVEVSPRSSDDKQGPSMYRKFLNKPLREQVTWPSRFLGPELDEEKTLIKRADDLTDRIAQKFCQYMQGLGGTQESQLFTPKTIKSLFQVDQDTLAARSLSIVPKELPCVLDQIAMHTKNEDKAVRNILHRQILSDVRAESKKDNLIAFGRALERKYQWKAPRNDTDRLWRSLKHVPSDLISLKTVWEGIEDIKSVREYCRWMVAHPEYRRPPFLDQLGMFHQETLNKRLPRKNKCISVCPEISTKDKKDVEVSMDTLRRRLSSVNDST